MPRYIEKLLTRLNHPTPQRPVHAPHDWNSPIYGRHIQKGIDDDTSEYLPTTDISRTQSIVGALLYYTRAVDPTMHPGLNEVSITQAKPTQQTLKKCLRLLDYVATHPNATIRFYASEMILNVNLDAAYLVLP